MSGEVGYQKIILFDLTQKKTLAELPLPGKLEDFDWVSVSPGGHYVVIDYADNQAERYHGLEVYDNTFHLLWQKGLGAGHSDLGLDNNGDEVLVMDYYDETLNTTTLKKFRLQDGATTNLLQISTDFDLHISCRNEANKDWCFISTFNYPGRSTDDPTIWLPFENEIFALKMDGSGQTTRLFHHRSRRYTPTTPDSDHSVYWAEPHATVSRKSNRILWGSNWKEDATKVQNVDAYIGEFSLDK